MKLTKSYIEDVMYGRQKAPFVEFFLQILSVVYSAVISLRRALVTIGVFKPSRLAQCVISVGNLTLGGTGKTPTVINIGRILANKQRQSVVISRGYGRKDESEVIIVSDRDGVRVDSTTGGDEPVLIGLKLTGTPVVVGSDRFKAALFAQEKFGNDTVILDDGFQHIRLARDLDIVLIDGSDPFGNGRLFPAGILREPISALKRAQVVLITGADRTRDLEALKNVIRSHTTAKIFTSRAVPLDLVDVMNPKSTKALSALKGTSVLAVSGIARPASFLTLLGSLGAKITTEFSFPDHHQYTRSDLAQIFQRIADDRIGMIVTTEKDAVRLGKLSAHGIWALRIELLVNEADEWERVLLDKA